MGRVKMTLGPQAGPAKPRGRLNKARVAAALVVVAVVVAVLVLLGRVVFPPKPPEPFRPEPAAAVIAPPPAAPALVEEKIVIPARSNLADLLKRRGFTDREIHDLREAVKPVYDLGKIRAGPGAAPGLAPRRPVAAAASTTSTRPATSSSATRRTGSGRR